MSKEEGKAPEWRISTQEISLSLYHVESFHAHFPLALYPVRCLAVTTGLYLKSNFTLAVDIEAFLRRRKER